MRAFETREGYQKIAVRFVTWCQHAWDLHDPEVIELFANRLVTQFLRQRMEEGKSAWTLKTERSALCLFFGDRALADELELPKRQRKNIKRSRLPAKRDRQINLANWQQVIQFCLATGMRREELRDLSVREVGDDPECPGRLIVWVRRGKGGKQRTIHVFPGRKPAVRSQIAVRDPNEHVFSRISGCLTFTPIAASSPRISTNCWPANHCRPSRGDWTQRAWIETRPWSSPASSATIGLTSLSGTT